MNHLSRICVLTSILLATTFAGAQTRLLVDESTPLGGNHYYNPWLGTFYTNDAFWLYHLELGWLYSAPATDTTAMWFYSPEIGWIFTGNGTYPSLYNSGNQGWWYFYSADSIRYFYSFVGNYYAATGSPGRTVSTIASASLTPRNASVGGQITWLSNSILAVSGFTYSGGGSDVRFIVSPNFNYSDYTVLSGNLVRSTAYQGVSLHLLLPQSLASANKLYFGLRSISGNLNLGSAELNR